MINVMLEDGLPYHVLIDELGEAGHGLNIQSLAEWVQGRYQEYLKDRDTIEHIKARKEFAFDPSLIYRACRVEATRGRRSREFADYTSARLARLTRQGQAPSGPPCSARTGRTPQSRLARQPAAWIQETHRRSADSLVRAFRKIGADQRADKAVRARAPVRALT